DHRSAGEGSGVPAHRIVHRIAGGGAFGDFGFAECVLGADACGRSIAGGRNPVWAVRNRFLRERIWVRDEKKRVVRATAGRRAADGAFVYWGGVGSSGGVGALHAGLDGGGGCGSDASASRAFARISFAPSAVA